MSSAPAGWAERALGAVLEGIDAGWSPACPERPPAAGEWGVLKVSAVTSGTFKEGESKALPALLSPRADIEVHAGDVLVSRANGVGSLVGVAAQAYETSARLMLSDKTLRLVPREPEIDRAFLFRLLHSAAVRAQVAALISGSSGQKNLSQAQIRTLKTHLPPLPEQRKIAEVLDTVDEAIRKTEAIIAKLKQVKQGLLHDLLTRGIDDNGELRDPERHPEQFKDSPLGRIPKEWEVCRVGECLIRPPKNGYSPQEADGWTGTLMLGLGCLTTEGFRARQLKNAPRSDSRVADSMLRDGDLLLSRANTRELVGLAGRYRDVGHPCSYPDLMMRLSPDSTRVTAPFLEELLRSSGVRRQIQAAAVGTSGSMVKISGRIVSNLSGSIPPVAEQRRITVGLARGDSRLLADQVALSKLRLLKQGLMEDLLTGRVRVTPLLDEATL